MDVCLRMFERTGKNSDYVYFGATNVQKCGVFRPQLLPVGGSKPRLSVTVPEFCLPDPLTDEAMES